MRAIALTLVLYSACYAEPFLSNPEQYQDLALELQNCVLSGDDASLRENCIGLFVERCVDDPEGETSFGMQRCSDDEITAWDLLLNHYYAQVIEAVRAIDVSAIDVAKPEQSPEDIFRDAQRDWLRYRESDASKELLIWYGGSGASVLASRRYLDLTAERVMELMRYCDDLVFDEECERF